MKIIMSKSGYLHNIHLSHSIPILIELEKGHEYELKEFEGTFGLFDGELLLAHMEPQVYCSNLSN